MTPDAAMAHPLMPFQAPSSHTAPLSHSQQESLPSHSQASLQSNMDNEGEPPAKRRAVRKQQPTQKAIEAGLAPALTGQAAHGHDPSGVKSMQHSTQQLHSYNVPVQSGGVPLNSAKPTQRLQAGMPVQ